MQFDDGNYSENPLDGCQSELYFHNFQIIPDMVVTGALNHVDNMLIEWHDVSTYRQGREPEMISKLVPAITT